MELKIFAVRDEKAQAFMDPFVVPHVGQATRSFQDASSNDRSPINKHPEDYTLFQIGTFDNESAKIVACTPVRICCASDFNEVKKSTSA